VLDDADHEVLRRRVATPQGDYAGTLASIAALVRDAQAFLGLAPEAKPSVGIGIPGSLSPVDGRVRNANSTCLNGQPFQADLERLLARPVRLENDANCLALSEASDGAGQGEGVVFAVILGTGVGGGWVVQGQLLSGHNRIAGEWGHNPLPWPQPSENPGRACWCGRRGCLETWLSGPALAFSLAGAANAQAVVAAAVAGNPSARAALEAWFDRCARALAAVVNLLDPDVIVVGGGLSHLPDLPAQIQSRWAPWVFSDRVTTPIRLALHGDASGVRGAARLWELGTVAPSAAQ
jgi:fructokinase